METLEQVRWRMIEGGARTAQTFGLNRLLGQIYMLLYMSREARSLDDIAAELTVSKASISIACRQMQNLGVVRRVWKKGDRKDYYEAETDLRRILDSRLLDSVHRSVDSARDQIRNCLEILRDGGHGQSADAAHMKKRLAEAQGYCDRIGKLLGNPILRKLL